MQLMPLLLVAIVMAADSGMRLLGTSWNLEPSAVWTIAWGPIVILLVLAWLTFAIVDRQLARGRRDSALMVADWTGRIVRWLILLNHAVVVLVFDELRAIRALVGDQILVDEFIAILPPLVGLIGLYWAYYPVEQRLRQAVLVRQLDEGKPIFPTMTRGQYVLLQARLQVLLMLVPVLLIVAVTEAIDVGLPRLVEGAPPWWLGRIMVFVGAASVFMFAPLLARVLLDVQPLPQSEIRADLQAVCDRHKVRTRDLLLWKTNGSMINAAVMGLIAPLRYVMITDMLLETLRREQVQAVMAHEVGHVRRHHMVWMIVCLMAALAIGAVITYVPLVILGLAIDLNELGIALDAVQAMSAVGPLAIGLVIFGWVSRRFERQADTFAVQHLSQHVTWPSDVGAPPIMAPAVRDEAVRAMQGALHTIAVMNAIPPDRSSWRHGSIGWRLRYLHSIVGKPLNSLRIDRIVKRIKIAALAIVLIFTPVELLIEWSARDSDTPLPRGERAGVSAEGTHATFIESGACRAHTLTPALSQREREEGRSNS